MSDHERFAQVAQRKLAIMSESLRSLTKNEQMSESLIFLSESLIRSFLDKNDGKPMSEFPALLFHNAIRDSEMCVCNINVVTHAY